MKILDYTIKTIKHPLLWGGLVGLFSACTNLDVDINSKYTEMPDNAIAVEANVNGCYYCFRPALGQRYSETQTLGQTYVALSFDGDYVDGQRYYHPTTHNYNPDDIGCTYWVDLESGITKCNNVLNNIEGKEDLKEYEADVKAMRAFYHFLLMDSYGDIPILDHLFGETEEIKRQPRKEVAEWIEKQLLAIIPDLKDEVSASTYGKPTKWMAEALLCKLYINWPIYTKDVTTSSWEYGTNEKLDACVAYCDSIINSDKFSLTGGTTSQNPYREKFYPTNGYQIEDFIYAMPFDAATDYAADKTSPSKYSSNSGNGCLYGRNRTWRKATGGTDEAGNTKTYLGSKIALSLAGIYSLVPWVSDLFTLPGDNRNDIIVGGEVPLYSQETHEIVGKWLYKGSPVELTHDITLKDATTMNAGANVTGWSQGYKTIKFWIDCNEYDQYTRYQSNDVPIFRLADVIMMKSEALTRMNNGKGDDAMTEFNKIRAYNNAPLLTSAPTLDDIFQERIREFLDENWDRNDFIRFGKFETGFNHDGMVNFPEQNSDPRHRILPVPTDMLNTDSNWSQNDGY